MSWKVGSDALTSGNNRALVPCMLQSLIVQWIWEDEHFPGNVARNRI